MHAVESAPFTTCPLCSRRIQVVNRRILSHFKAKVLDAQTCKASGMHIIHPKIEEDKKPAYIEKAHEQT